MKDKRNKLPAILSLIMGLACFFLFIPTLEAGMVNAGNLLGLGLGLLLLLYGLFRRRLPLWLRRSFWGVMGAFFLLVAVSGAMIAGQAGKEPEQEGTVIILGCGVRGETPSLMLRTRIEAARTYLLAHPAAKAVCTGGLGERATISEALCIYRELVAAGIEAERLYIEDRSVSTSENLLYAGEIARQEGLPQPWVIISSEFHVYRAAHMAERLGIPAQTLGAHTPRWLLPTYFLRECLAVMKEWVWPDPLPE